MLFYALVSDEIGQVVDFYATREEAEAELRDPLSDEPEWEDVLRVELSSSRRARTSSLARIVRWGRMPKRTNLFQEVVEIIHRHMAGDAEVESPALLPSRSTGDLREVDVVIRGQQARQEVIVSVEAIARSRKAAVGWVEEMVGKHDDLPTNKLVLVSEKEFTRQGREAALARGAVPLAPEDLRSEDPDAAVIRVLPALWPKVVTFALETIGVKFVDYDVPKDGWGQDPPLVGIVEGEEWGDRREPRTGRGARLEQLPGSHGTAWSGVD